jgi:uncharacterized protein YpmB
MKKESFLIPLAIIIAAIIISLAFIYTNTHNKKTIEKIETLEDKARSEIEIVNSGDHIIGSRDADIFII